MFSPPVPRRTALVAALCCACTVVACSPSRDASRTPAAPTAAPLLPVYRPEGLDPRSRLDGVYGDQWTAPKVTFGVAVPRTARRMTLDLWVPENFFKRGEQGIGVKIGDAAVQSKHGLPLGRQKLSFAVPPASRGRAVNVELMMDAAFVPADIGANSDRRRLAVRFYKVSFE